MITPQKVLLPGIFIGCVTLALIAHLLTSAQPAQAATPAPTEAAVAVGTTVAEQTEAACSLSLPASIAPWCGLIEQTAQKYGVSANLIAAVMLQESGGQSDVVSASGAVGLMQVMPNDGIAASFLCDSGPCFAARPSTQELLDPTFNVDYGVRLLADLLQKYGSEREALRAYGPYNVGYYYADKVLAIQQSL